MLSKILCLTLLSASLSVTAALADGAAAPAAASTPGGVRISIKNVYEAEINFGPLGKGWRKGTDMAEGVLKRQGNDYAGIFTASVESDQQVKGLGMGCGPDHYEDLQELQVIGHRVSGFNNDVQSVTPAAIATQASNEYLKLEFVPKSATSQQPNTPGQDQIVNCHTLIETESGISFLPLNDSRWTMAGGGYVIALPSAGVLEYTDDTLAPRPNQPQLPTVPFNAKKSIWTIKVERLP